MRHVIAGLAVVFATLLVIQVSGSTSSALSPAVQGDTDCNGVVAAPDLTRILSHLADIDDGSDCNDSALDVNCDNATDVRDGLDLLYYFVELLLATPGPGCAGIGSPLPTSDTVTPSSVTSTPETTTATPVTITPTVTDTTTTPTQEPTPTPPVCAAGVPTPTIAPAPSPVPTAPVVGAYNIFQLMECLHFAVPTDFAAVPGKPDEALVSTQNGLVWRVSLSGQFQPTIAADLRDRVQRNSDEGLLSVTFQPENPDYVYVNYNTGTAYDTSVPNSGGQTANRCDGIPAMPNPPNPKRNVIARFPYNDNTGVIDESSQHIVMEIPRPHCWHNVSQLAFDPRPGQQDILYIGSGDGGGIGSPYDDHNEPLNNLRGVIMRIRMLPNGDYAIPTGNPFADGTGPNADEIWAYEFRHPWRLAVNPANGDVWTGDVGQEKWEEIDKVVAGGNYGWPLMEGFHCYPPPPTPPPSPTPTPTEPSCVEPGVILPVAEYAHGAGGGCAIAVGYVYQGAALPELDGWLIYGDYCSGRIWALNATGSGGPVELVKSVASIVSFGQLPDGELVVLDKDGRIYLLVRSNTP